MPVTTLTSTNQFTIPCQSATYMTNEKELTRVKLGIDMTDNDFDSIRHVLADLYMEDKHAMSSMTCSFDVNARFFHILPPLKKSNVKKDFSFPFSDFFPDAQNDIDEGENTVVPDHDDDDDQLPGVLKTDTNEDGEIVNTISTMWNEEKMKTMVNQVLEESPDHERSFDLNTQLTVYKHLEDMERFFVSVPSAKYHIGANDDHEEAAEMWTVETTAFAVDLVREETSYLNSTVTLGCTDGEKSGCKLSDPAAAVKRQSESEHMAYAITPEAASKSKSDGGDYSVHSDLKKDSSNDISNFLERLLGDLEIIIDVILSNEDVMYGFDEFPIRKLSSGDSSDEGEVSIRIEILGVINHTSEFSYHYVFGGNGLELDVLVNPVSGFTMGLYVSLLNSVVGFELYHLELSDTIYISGDDDDSNFYTYAIFPEGRNPITTDGRHPVTVESTLLEWIMGDSSTNFAIINNYSGSTPCGSIGQNDLGSLKYCFDDKNVNFTFFNTDNKDILSFGGLVTGDFRKFGQSEFVIFLKHDFDFTLPLLDVKMARHVEIFFGTSVESDEFYLEFGMVRLGESAMQDHDLLHVSVGTSWHESHHPLNWGLSDTELFVKYDDEEVLGFQIAESDMRILDEDDEYFSLYFDKVVLTVSGDEVLNMSTSFAVFINGIETSSYLALGGEEVFFGNFEFEWHAPSVYMFDFSVENLEMRMNGDEIIFVEMAMGVEELEDDYDNHWYV